MVGEAKNEEANIGQAKWKNHENQQIASMHCHRYLRFIIQ